MHVLWISDSPTTPSGFGNVTRHVCNGLACRGHRVSILGWQTRRPFEWNGCQVYATGMDSLGGDALYAFLLRHRPEAVISLADVWWLSYFTAPHVRRQMELTGTPWILYFPIDGNTEDGSLPPSWIEILKAVDIPVAMSLYGQRVAAACGIHADYIPHGVDLDIFSPPEDREQAKERAGLAGRFVVLSDSRNQPRKMLPRLLRIFAEFARRRPDTVLHLHTDPDDEFTHSSVYSYDVRADARHLGIDTQVRFTEGFKLREGGGLPLTQIAALYRAADVHLLASSGEGFGLPTLQAAAAGAVPFAGAYTASLELVQGHGEAVRIAEWSHNEFGIRRALIDVDDTVARLDRYYQDRALLRERSQLSRRFALGYGWSGVVDQWDALLGAVKRGAKRVALPPSTILDLTHEVHLPSLPKIPGLSVTVKTVKREAGRLEAAILADARGNNSEVRIPTLLPSCEVGGVRVPRRWAYVGLDPADIGIFLALKRLFPVTHAWALTPGATALPETVRGLEYLLVQVPQDARFELAQSELLINLSGGLPEQLLIDAALYGVCCIGSCDTPVQKQLWPEIAARGPEEALDCARELFTNPVAARRISEKAVANCRRIYRPDEADSAKWLRSLHAAQRVTGVAAGR